MIRFREDVVDVFWAWVFAMVMTPLIVLGGVAVMAFCVSVCVAIGWCVWKLIV